jgi:hypothetical protein
LKVNGRQVESILGLVPGKVTAKTSHTPPLPQNIRGAAMFYKEILK